MVNAPRCLNPMHPAHAQQRMRCSSCGHTWVDCPGAWGWKSSAEAVPPKGGCPGCGGHKYWTAENLH